MAIGGSSAGPPHAKETKGAAGRHAFIAEVARGYLGALWLARDPGDASASPVFVRHVAPLIAASARAAILEGARWGHSAGDAGAGEVIEARSGVDLVTPFLDAEPLRALLRTAALKHAATESAILMGIVRDLLRQLSVLHDRARAAKSPHGFGGVHPDSIFVGLDGQVHLLDVGAGAAASAREPWRSDPQRVGYFAPEQIDPRGVADARTDVFAIGIALWEALANRRLFPGNDAKTARERVQKSAIARLDATRPSASAGVPSAVADLVARALERDPAARFQTAEEMAEAVSELECAHPSGVGAWVTALADVAIGKRHQILNRAGGASLPPPPPDAQARPLTAEALLPADDPAPARPVTSAPPPRVGDSMRPRSPSIPPAPSVPRGMAPKRPPSMPPSMRPKLASIAPPHPSPSVAPPPPSAGVAPPPPSAGVAPPHPSPSIAPPRPSPSIAPPRPSPSIAPAAPAAVPTSHAPVAAAAATAPPADPAATAAAGTAPPSSPPVPAASAAATGTVAAPSASAVAAAAAPVAATTATAAGTAAAAATATATAPSSPPAIVAAAAPPSSPPAATAATAPPSDAPSPATESTSAVATSEPAPVADAPPRERADSAESIDVLGDSDEVLGGASGERSVPPPPSRRPVQPAPPSATPGLPVAGQAASDDTPAGPSAGLSGPLQPEALASFSAPSGAPSRVPRAAAIAALAAVGIGGWLIGRAHPSQEGAASSHESPRAESSARSAAAPGSATVSGPAASAAPAPGSATGSASAPPGSATGSASAATGAPTTEPAAKGAALPEDAPAVAASAVAPSAPALPVAPTLPNAPALPAEPAMPTAKEPSVAGDPAAPSRPASPATAVPVTEARSQETGAHAPRSRSVPNSGYKPGGI